MIANCLDCHGPVSTRARFCPHCGAPRAEADPTTTIQLTGKDIKLTQLAGRVGVLLGLVLILINADTRPVGGVLFVGGMALVISARIRRWWNHA